MPAAPARSGKMRTGFAAAATLACGFCCADASAGFAGNLALVSDYDYRGISQTAGDPALQGTLGYTHDSGFYGTLWGSTLDWGDSDAEVELDWFAGYATDIGESGVRVDAGLLYYHYPGLSSANFLEFYTGLSWSLFRVKLSYSDDFAGVGKGAFYADGGLTYAWDNGFSLFAYGGYSFGDTFDHDAHGYALGIPDYWNYGFGAGYSFAERMYVELKGVGTDLDGQYKIGDGVFDNSFRAVASFTVSFP
jgi:uncharacterized protein (TIGR02001 family)